MMPGDFEQAPDAVYMLGGQPKIPPQCIAQQFAESREDTGSAVHHAIAAVPRPMKTGDCGGHDDRKNAHYQYNRGLHTV